MRMLVTVNYHDYAPYYIKWFIAYRGEKINNKPQTEQEVTMSIIRIEQERVKASDETDIDVTATELLGFYGSLWWNHTRLMKPR